MEALRGKLRTLRLGCPACRYCGTVLPHRARAAEQAEIVTQLLADKNRDGVPDALEGLVAATQASPKRAATPHAVEPPSTAPKKKKKKKKQPRAKTELELVLDELEHKTELERLLAELGETPVEEPAARDAMGRPYNAFNKPLSRREITQGTIVALITLNVLVVAACYWG